MLVVDVVIKSELQIGLVEDSLSNSRFSIGWWSRSFQLDSVILHTDKQFPPFT